MKYTVKASFTGEKDAVNALAKDFWDVIFWFDEVRITPVQGKPHTLHIDFKVTVDDFLTVEMLDALRDMSLKNFHVEPKPEKP